MKKFFVFIFGLLCLHIYAQNVVINEVLYDPDGSDGGYEWIELYNNSNDLINLHNWTIVKAGTSFSLVFILPSINIQPHGFLLIGEEFVPDTDLITDLSFQNGGSATDGIRIISYDGFYTDTILYDSPNSNNLPDDISSPGSFFAVDVSSGNSLARKQDGIDSNNCEQDFFECENPTPGEENFYPIDLAVYDVEIVLNNGDYWLETEVFNLSTENVDNYEASVEITINTEFYGSYDLPEIPAESSIPFSCNLEQFSANYNLISAEVIYMYDNILDNNFAANSILTANSDLVLNEVLFRPQSTNQEWLEIFNRGDCGYLVDNWKIIDASGGQINFSCVLQPNDFIVVCEDANLMFQIYPEIDPNLVIQSDDWTSLNNTEESLTFMDNYSVVFDSMYYDGSGCPSDFSLERVNPFDDENIEWLVSLDSLGTPSLQNSVLPIEKDLSLEFRDIEEIDGEIQHTIFVENRGLENINSVLLTCFKTELETGNQQEVYIENLIITDSLEIVFNTDFPSNGYYEFNYEIYSDEDMDESNNFAHSFFNRSALPFVINEIMYDPSDDLPEWLEIKQNFPVPDLEEFYLVVDEDTLCLPFFDEEFALVTSSYSDADTLQQ
ncbi:MAG: lamin tail domain-containing protein, partial [Candidatus Cloacimonetes bacterium]|nr:lamin tail domain-containing protein [Candidatus Cloacimonadota bacterium]